MTLSFLRTLAVVLFHWPHIGVGLQSRHTNCTTRIFDAHTLYSTAFCANMVRLSEFMGIESKFFEHNHKMFLSAANAVN